MTRPGIVAAAAAAALAIACSVPMDPEPVRRPGAEPRAGEAPERRARPQRRPAPERPSRWEREACSLPRRWLVRTWRGYAPRRSGEIQFVPREFSYFDSWSHSGPWAYLQAVPFLLFGPGHVRARGSVERPATAADVAPTLAALARFRFRARDGEPLKEAFAARRGPPPRLIVTVVWDGAGRNVLAEWPRAWPVLRRLKRRGVWYENFTVGSSPSVTPATHTTIGTGAFPRRHGVVDLRFRVGGKPRKVRADLARFILRPAMVDLYERARDNEPVVGMIGSLGAIGMIGRGAGFPGGDRDVVAGQTLDGWRLSPSGRPLYRFPRYVRSVPGLARELRRLDLADGKLDRSWRGRPFPPDVSELPAFAPYQTSVVRELIRRERFGRDRVPDFLFVNYKQIDKIGHRSSMNSSEMAAAVRSSDAALGTIVRMLDREVGRGRWVLALTADHGATPDRSVTGGPALDTQDLYADLLARFDRDGDDVPAIQSARLTQIWVDETELAENGFEVEDVARFLARYRVSDNAGSGMPAGRPDRTAFTAAFPSEVLKDLACLRDTKRRNG